MAEFVFRDLVKKRGLQDLFQIESRATFSDELGSRPHEGTRKKLAGLGIDCSGKRAELFNKQDAARFDYLIGMDAANLSRIRQIGKESAQGKTYKLMEFTARVRDIADPWYTHDFDTTYYDVYEGCQGLLEYIIHHNLKNE